jgi:hypothetical protein
LLCFTRNKNHPIECFLFIFNLVSLGKYNYLKNNENNKEGGAFTGSRCAFYGNLMCPLQEIDVSFTGNF